MNEYQRKDFMDWVLFNLMCKRDLEVFAKVKQSLGVGG